MSWNSSVAAPFLLTFLFLTSCVIPIPVPASPARVAAKLEPPAQYNHAYNGQVVEHVMPEAEARALFASRWVLISSRSLARGRLTGPAMLSFLTTVRPPVDTYRRTMDD